MGAYIHILFLTILELFPIIFGITGGGGGGEDFQITKQKWLLVVPVAAADTKSVTVTAAIDIAWVLIGNLSCDRGLIPAAFFAQSCV